MRGPFSQGCSDFDHPHLSLVVGSPHFHIDPPPGVMGLSVGCSIYGNGRPLLWSERKNDLFFFRPDGNPPTHPTPRSLHGLIAHLLATIVIFMHIALLSLARSMVVTRETRDFSSHLCRYTHQRYLSKEKWKWPWILT